MATDPDAERYFARLAVDAGTPSLTAAEMEAVLDLARVVAHTSERRFAPLSAYVAGLSAAAAGGNADDRAARVVAVREAAQRLAQGGDGG